MADADRLARDADGAERRGYARRRPAARGRRGVLLQDDDARIRLEGHHPWPADRHHPQSLGCFAHARRLQRRLGRAGGGRRRAAGHRRRWRRLDPDSGGVQRRVRVEAELRRGAELAGPDGHARGLWRPVARRRRQRLAAERADAAGRAGFLRGPISRHRLSRRPRRRVEGPADRMVARSRLSGCGSCRRGRHAAGASTH